MYGYTNTEIEQQKINRNYLLPAILSNLVTYHNIGDTKHQ